MAAKPLPPQDLLHQLLRYEPETGKLYWRERPVSSFEDGEHSAERRAIAWNGKYAGTEACSAKKKNGYLNGRFFGSYYFAHRVIWKMVHGSDPEHIDHVNGIKADNRITNLRSVSNHINHKNMPRQNNNTSGVTGVGWHGVTQKYHARIKVSGRTIHLGLFETFEDAVAAREAAELRYGFHRNHGRRA